AAGEQQVEHRLVVRLAGAEGPVEKGALRLLSGQRSGDDVEPFGDSLGDGVGDDVVLDRLLMTGDAFVELDDEVGGLDAFGNADEVAQRRGEVGHDALLLPRGGAAGRQAATWSRPMPRRASSVVVVPAMAVAGLTPERASI